MALVSIQEAGGNLAEFSRLNFAAFNTAAVGNNALNHLVRVAAEHGRYDLLAVAQPYLADHDSGETQIEHEQ